MLVHGVDADPGLSPYHAQQSPVVHRIHQVGRRARGAAPVVGDGAVREVRVDLAWMHGAVRADEVEQRADVPAARRSPRRRTAARVHQRLHRAGDEAVVDEDVFVNVEARVATFEIAGAIARHAVTKREILRAGRRADRVRLDEAEHVECALQRGRRKRLRATANRAQVVKGHSGPLCVVSETSRANRARRFRVRQVRPQRNLFEIPHLPPLNVGTERGELTAARCQAMFRGV